MRVTRSPDSAQRISIAGGTMSVGQHRVLQADPLERPKHVGTELDAGADLAELRRLLQHPHRKSLARERIGGRKSADAAAGDQDGSCAIRLGHRKSSAGHYGGEPGWSRTNDLLIKSQLLYR